MPITILRLLQLGLAMALFTLGLQAPAAASWPVITAPPDSRVAWVGKDMKLNGVPMQIKHFSSRLSRGEVLDFYRSRWGSAVDKKSVENNLSDWKVIGTQSGDYYLTVQVRPANSRGSEGFMAVTMLPAIKDQPKLGGNFPRMGGSTVLTDVESNDDGKLANLLVLSNRFSVASNAAYYETTMSAQGWTRDSSYGGPQAGGRAYAMFFRRENKELNIVINRIQKGTAITANIVTNQFDD